MKERANLFGLNESLFCMQKRFASVLAKVVRILGLYYLYLAVVMVVGNWFCNMSWLKNLNLIECSEIKGNAFIEVFYEVVM